MTYLSHLAANRTSHDDAVREDRARRKLTNPPTNAHNRKCARIDARRHALLLIASELYHRYRLIRARNEARTDANRAKLCGRPTAVAYWDEFYMTLHCYL